VYDSHILYAALTFCVRPLLESAARPLRKVRRAICMRPSDLQKCKTVPDNYKVSMRQQDLGTARFM
jgi:hypothetical protein